MDTKQISPVILLAVGAGVLLLLGFGVYRIIVPPPPPGNYTPGVPPWMDKKNPNYGKSPVPPPPSGGPAGTSGH